VKYHLKGVKSMVGHHYQGNENIDRRHTALQEEVTAVGSRTLRPAVVVDLLEAP